MEARLHKAHLENGVRLASALLLTTLHTIAHTACLFREQHGEYQGHTSDASPFQLYLAAGESDQATSGHNFMDNLRAVMHGLPADVPIMVCEYVHATALKGELLQRDVIDLSQKHFTAGSDLIVWPGECQVLGHSMSSLFVVMSSASDVVCNS